MNDATLKVVPVISRAKTTPAIDSTDEVRIAVGAEKLRNSASRTPKTSAKRKQKNAQKFMKGLLLLLIGSAVLDAYGGRQMHGRDRPLHFRDGRSEIRAFEPGCDRDELL